MIRTAGLISCFSQYLNVQIRTKDLYLERHTSQMNLHVPAPSERERSFAYLNQIRVFDTLKNNTTERSGYTWDTARPLEPPHPIEQPTVQNSWDRRSVERQTGLARPNQAVDRGTLIS